MKTNRIIYLALHCFAGGPQWYTEDLFLSVYITYRMPVDHSLSCSKRLPNWHLDDGTSSSPKPYIFHRQPIGHLSRRAFLWSFLNLSVPSLEGWKVSSVPLWPSVITPATSEPSDLSQNFSWYQLYMLPSPLQSCILKMSSLLHQQEEAGKKSPASPLI